MTFNEATLKLMIQQIQQRLIVSYHIIRKNMLTLTLFCIDVPKFILSNHLKTIKNSKTKV